MVVQDYISALEEIAPLSYQEEYDNAGLIVGTRDDEVSKALICLDVTQEVVQEAVEVGANLIISHHPLVFRPLKKINDASEVERCIKYAIKNDIAIYASHTNMDNVMGGVNSKICEKIGLIDTKILVPQRTCLTKLVTYVPVAYLDSVRQALYAAGAGCIGNYEKCGFFVQGTGSFQAMENTHPFVGEKNEFHEESECRLETVFPNEKTSRVLSALFKYHPYEEVAYDLFPLKNEFSHVGAGMIGMLPEPEDARDFLARLKRVFGCGVVRHTAVVRPQVRCVAVCGGSGSFLVKDAIRAGADVYVTADVKYHEFFQTENKMILADIGHYESEQFTKELFYELLMKKNYKFAVQISKVNTNPINYI